MPVTLYPAANFIDSLTLNMGGGTGLGLSTWTINQDISGLPSTFPFKMVVYTSGSESSTREIVQVSAKNTGTRQITISVRADEDTTAIDHPNGSIIGLFNTAGMENAQNDAIADLYLNGGTMTVTSGEAYAATTTVSGVTLPTLLYQRAADGLWYKADADALESGLAQSVAMAYELSSGAAQSVRVYLPGSVVTGAGMTIGTPYYTSGTAGGLEALNTSRVYYKLIGYAQSTTQFLFFPTSDTTLSAVNGGAGVYLTSADTFSVGMVGFINSSGTFALANASDATRYPAGGPLALGIALSPTSGAAQPIRVARAGQVAVVSKQGGGSWTVGSPVYIGTSYGLATQTVNPDLLSLFIGVAVSATEVYLCPGQDTYSSRMVIQNVPTGENWSTFNLLYFKKSDQKWYKTDADSAESGICEFPALALTTHTGGSSGTALVAMPGSIIKGSFIFGAGDRLFPSATSGDLQGNTPASYDTFYREVGILLKTNEIYLYPQQMEFLPTGIQEKGMAGAAWQIDNSVTTANDKFPFLINFRKQMVNTPSSLTLTSTYTENGTPTATTVRIERWGAVGYATMGGAWSDAVKTVWAGTYQTVGN